MAPQEGHTLLFFRKQAHQVNWRELLPFLILTYGLTYGLNYGLYLAGGYGSSIATAPFLQVQTLIPGFVAICLGLFVYPDCHFYILGSQPYKGRARLFLYAYLVYALFFSALAIWMAVDPQKVVTLRAVNSTLTSVLLLWLIFVRLTSPASEFAEIGLGGGRALSWLIGGLAVVAYHVLSAWLNLAWGMGTRVDLAEEFARLGFQGGLTGDLITFQLVLALQIVIVGTFLNLGFGFSEQLGWRGLVQDLLLLGKRRRGALLVALLWAISSWPIVGMGHPGPRAALEAILVFTVLALPWGILLSYVVLKTGSLWFAGFLQIISQQASAYLTGFVVRPEPSFFTLGIGLPALFPLLIFALIALRDPVWVAPEK